MSPSDIYPLPHFSFRPLVLTIAFLFAGMNGAAAAEDSTPKATYIDTQPIVVTATRTSQPLSGRKLTQRAHRAGYSGRSACYFG